MSVLSIPISCQSLLTEFKRNGLNYHPRLAPPPPELPPPNPLPELELLEPESLLPEPPPEVPLSPELPLPPERPLPLNIAQMKKNKNRQIMNMKKTVSTLLGCFSG